VLSPPSQVLRPHPTPTRLGATSRSVGYTHRLLLVTADQGRGGPPQLTCSPSGHPVLPTPESSSAPAFPGLRRLPWPSPWIQRLGTPLSLCRVSVTGLQGSLDAAGWSVAPPKGAFDAGLRRRAFPPDAASLLPGLLAATRTGLSPAGGHALVDVDHLKPHHLLSSVASAPRLLGTRNKQLGGTI
jgi:hypothetical protein